MLEISLCTKVCFELIQFFVLELPGLEVIESSGGF
jgi:hypothetical protein